MSVIPAVSSSEDSLLPDAHVPPLDPAPLEERIVVLVHGTKLPRFRRRSRPETYPWTDERSDFRRTLAPDLKGTTFDDKFIWSGTNSHVARLQAGDELASYLENKHAEHPAARLIILAHSHGGTVSLYAMQELRSPDYVSDLIFMNTPFFECKKRDLGALAILILLSFMGLFMGGGILTMNYSWSGYFTAAMMTAFFLMLLLYIPASKRLPPVQEFLYRRINLRYPPTRLTNVTCDDEVRLWLGLADYVSRLPFRIWSFVTGWGSGLFVVSFAISMACGIAAMTITFAHHNNLDTATFAGHVVTVLLIGFGIGAGIPLAAIVIGFCGLVSSFIAILVLEMFRGNRFAFGDDLTEALLLDIDAQNEPPVHDQQNYVMWKYSGVSFGHRHFAYQYPPAVDYVRKALNNLGDWERRINIDDDLELANPPFSQPEKLTWRSLLSDFKTTKNPEIVSTQQSKGNRILTRIIGSFIAIFFILIIASSTREFFSSRKQTLVLRADGFPSNYTFSSDVDLPSGLLKWLATTVSGYQDYLESIGHPSVWSPVSVSVVPSLQASSPGDASGRVQQRESAANSFLLFLNGRSLPSSSEFIKIYSEILFTLPIAASESSNYTSEAITEAVTQYFCSGYVGNPCESLSSPATWPVGTMNLDGAISGGYALAQALFEIRDGVGNNLMDRAVMRALVVAESHQRADIQSFVETINQQLGDHAAFARTSFAAHGIPTN